MAKVKNILKLNIYRIWFDKIACGEKRIEYRDATPFWRKRIENRDYDEIRFTNGYRAGAPFMRVEYLGYFKDADFYCLRLGKILEVFIP